MKFCLKTLQQPTLIPAELIEIYQPILGYETIAVWVNIYHSLINKLTVSESDLLQQMNISQKTFRSSIDELKKYNLVETQDKILTILPPQSVSELLNSLQNGAFSSEQKRRLTTLAETFQLKRGQEAYCQEEKTKPAIQETENYQLNEQRADEFATRFIKECHFIPNKQLRERFDLWFEQIHDTRLLEELLERTKRKVQMEGNKGSCPSLYADKIVSQWLVQGIRTYADLQRHDQEFHARWEHYRIVEKELGRSFNSLTPAEKEVIDTWITSVEEVGELRKIIKRAILSGEYQGKGSPSIAFINKWFSGGGNPKPSGPSPKNKKFAHRHELSDLQKVIERKTMVGLEVENSEG